MFQRIPIDEMPLGEIAIAQILASKRKPEQNVGWWLRQPHLTPLLEGDNQPIRVEFYIHYSEN